MCNETSRRKFLKKTANTAAAAASMAARPMYAASAQAKPGPNETVNVGLIGCGERGPVVGHEFMQCKGCRIVAVCDVHESRLAAARARFGGDNVLVYHDYRKLLDNEDIDAVIVATNGHWHALQAIDACKAGKDVYVEKPLATSIGEGRAAVQAARKYDRIVQIGTQQHSWEHYQKAAEIVQSGRLGEISEVKVWDYENQFPGLAIQPDGDPPAELDWNFWLGPSPKVPYNPNRFANHYWYFDYAGAWQLDWAVHHYDIVHWFLGVEAPKAATALGGNLWAEDDCREWPDTFSGILEYGPGPVAKNGFLLQYTFRGGCRREQRSHGKCFFGTEGSMIIDRSGFTIMEEPGDNRAGVRKESFLGSSPNHAQVFLNHVRNHTRPESDVEVGHFASNPGHLMNIAWKVNRKIVWDAEKEQVVGDEEANALVMKGYREPWKLEV